MRYLRLLPAALIVPAAVLMAAPASAATISVCAVGCDHTSVGAAVTAANANDTITVAAGTYNESMVKITEPVTITGAGVGTTVLDGGGLNKQIFDIRPGAATGDGPININGMTLTNAGTATYDIYLGIKAATTGITSIEFDDLAFDGGGTTGYGIYADSNVTAGVNREAPPLTISDSTFTATKYNNIGIDSYDGDVTISGNEMHEGATGNSAIFVGNEYTPFRLTGEMSVTNNTITDGRLFHLRNFFGFVGDFAGYDTVTVNDNDISGLGGNDSGIFVGSNSIGADNADPSIGDVTVTGNTIRGNLSAGSSGVTISGRVDEATVSDNDITGVVNGLNVTIDNGDNPSAITAMHNRLFADTNGVSNSTSVAVAATENWWGCQTDPLLGGSFCSDAENTGAGSIVTDPWVVTTAALGDTSILTGASTSITTDLGHLSDGSAVALPSFFAGLPSAFAASAGTVNPTAGSLDGSFADSSTYTAPLVAGPQTVTVTLDQDGVVTGEPVVLAIDITELPIDNGDGDGDGNGDGDAGSGDDDAAALPDTGASTSWWQPWLAGFMILFGAVMAWTGGHTGRPEARHKLAL